MYKSPINASPEAGPDLRRNEIPIFGPGRADQATSQTVHLCRKLPNRCVQRPLDFRHGLGGERSDQVEEMLGELDGSGVDALLTDITG